MTHTEQVLWYYNRANKRGRVIICAIIIIVAEKREEDKALLEDFMNGKRGREVFDDIYDKYCSLVRERLAQGRLI